MAQENTNQKGPIDYGRFFEEKKPGSSSQAQAPNQPLSQPVIGKSAQPGSGFLGKLIDSWTFAEKKTKIELIIFIIAGLATLVFASLYIAGRSQKAPSIPAGPENLIPSAEKGIMPSVPLPEF